MTGTAHRGRVSHTPRVPPARSAGLDSESAADRRRRL